MQSKTVNYKNNSLQFKKQNLSQINVNMNDCFISIFVPLEKEWKSKQAL